MSPAFTASYTVQRSRQPGHPRGCGRRQRHPYHLGDDRIDPDRLVIQVYPARDPARARPPRSTPPPRTRAVAERMIDLMHGCGRHRPRRDAGRAALAALRRRPAHRRRIGGGRAGLRGPDRNRWAGGVPQPRDRGPHRDPDALRGRVPEPARNPGGAPAPALGRDELDNARGRTAAGDSIGLARPMLAARVRSPRGRAHHRSHDPDVTHEGPLRGACTWKNAAARDRHPQLATHGPTRHARRPASVACASWVWRWAPPKATAWCTRAAGRAGSDPAIANLDDLALVASPRSACRRAGSTAMSWLINR
jgi:hypothetical protein